MVFDGQCKSGYRFFHSCSPLISWFLCSLMESVWKIGTLRQESWFSWELSNCFVGKVHNMHIGQFLTCLLKPVEDRISFGGGEVGPLTCFLIDYFLLLATISFNLLFVLCIFTYCLPFQLFFVDTFCENLAVLLVCLNILHVWFWNYSLLYLKIFLIFLLFILKFSFSFIFFTHDFKI